MYVGQLLTITVIEIHMDVSKPLIVYMQLGNYAC